MTTGDQEPCRRCCHQRRYHHPEKCTFEDCTCIGFSNMRVDPATARAEIDNYFRQAVFALREAFSSDQEIWEQMHKAADRIMRHVQ
jgi:hypothetical protein